MPFTKDGISPDLIVNPNAFVSRMTIGQLFECLLGKVAAIKGKIMDATPFSGYDIEEAKEYLKSKGYDENGEEELICGLTG
jgi:DNA-directed RNA polymerase beta subunit